jgi:hypothetical protein
MVKYKIMHVSSIVVAIAMAIALLYAILFGFDVSVEKLLGVKRSLRDVAIVLWTILLPGWFWFEEAWFAPQPSDATAVNAFLENQRKARLTWVLIASAIGAVIGWSAPESQSKNPASQSTPPIASGQVSQPTGTK